ncbi:hypothetical protein V7x_24070 [Crateriforma conspicua]|uniref:Uncharacterized protein n=1 Tax=Crateriforma conspicua TaxID=2527996 RepID=A0A5C6FWT0_9PLAN|nr:hypothetical protein V7x_24070 [Crateriforma conspicua]
MRNYPRCLMAETPQKADNLDFAATEWIAMNTERRAYRSDISDEQWQFIGPEPVRLTPPSHLGQPRQVDLREGV